MLLACSETRYRLDDRYHTRGKKSGTYTDIMIV